MGELAVAIFDMRKKKDGDILSAFSDEHILLTNAYNIFWPRIDNDPFKPKVKGFLGNKYPLLRLCLQLIYEYEFMQITQNEIIVRNLLTNEITICSKYAKNPKWRIDIDKIKTTLDNIPVFEEQGKKVWYGGRCNYSWNVINKIWDYIEEYINDSRHNYMLWPAGKEELKHFLFIRTEPFDNNIAKTLLLNQYKDKKISVQDSSVFGANNLTVMNTEKKHPQEEGRYCVFWRDLPGFSSDTYNCVIDKNKEVDIRQAVEFKLFDILYKVKE